MPRATSSSALGGSPLRTTSLLVIAIMRHATAQPHGGSPFRTTQLLLPLLCTAAAAFPALPSPPPVFVPSYEWQNVAEGMTIPAGLDVKLELHAADETRKLHMARIPPSWRLQLWLDSAHAFARVDVERHTTIGWVESQVVRFAQEAVEASRRRHHAAEHHHAAPDASMMSGAGGGGTSDVAVDCSSLELWSNGARLPVGATAEAIDLFAKQRTLVLRGGCTVSSRR